MTTQGSFLQQIQVPPPDASRRGFLWLPLVLGVLLMPPRATHAQETLPTQSSIDTTAAAGDADAVEPKRKLVKWNEYDGPVTTVRLGMVFLTDVVDYNQDSESHQQFPDLAPDVGLRDFRFLLKGRLKTKRPISWTLGYMYDGADEEWHFRQTGVEVGFPEVSSRLFFGRTKEGYSMIKVMVGVHGWLNERSQSNDAFVPILADGVKLQTYLKKPRIHFSFGGYVDDLSEDEKFATSDNQISSRLVWQPILSEEDRSLLHLGVMGRLFHPDNGNIQVRARPGVFLAPYWLDTGKFASDDGEVLGAEAFYRKGSWMFGGEYNREKVHAVVSDTNPVFWGADAVLAWNITGETRTYNAPGAFFTQVSPTKSVFEGGPGAWEVVLHAAYSDFDDGLFNGGKYFRVTPMANWHMSENLRLEFTYGYGVLDRFALKGGTQFFQFRLQTTL